MAATTRFVFTPFGAEFPASNFPQLQLVNQRPVLSFDASTDETAYWTAVAPQGLTGVIHVKVYYIMASAVSGSVEFQASLEAVTPGDAVDLDAGTSFDTANDAGAQTVPGTAGYLNSSVYEITMTNADSIAAGDYFRLGLNRNADDATHDTATGDCHVLAVEVTDGN